MRFLDSTVDLSEDKVEQITAPMDLIMMLLAMDPPSSGELETLPVATTGFILNKDNEN